MSVRSVTTLERVAALPVTAVWLFGALSWPSGLPASFLWVLVVAGGVGLGALWKALFTSSFDAWPVVARLLLGAGLLVGICLALYFILTGVLTSSVGTVSIFGCVLVPGCRHCLRVLRWSRHRTLDSMKSARLSDGMAAVQQQASPSLGQMVVRLAVAVAVGLGIDAAFWFSADFGRFVPASSGPFAERLLFTGLTASGPFAMAINGHFSNLVASLITTSGLCIGLIAWAFRKRHHVTARLGGYFGVALWFFFGFAVAGLRIT